VPADRRGFLMTEATEVRGAGRDRDELHDRLAEWFAAKLPGSDPVVSELHRPESNGMSSESILFDVELTEDGVRHTRSCVARLAPEDDSVPVFPTYDMVSQFRVIGVVASSTAVPVPEPLWLEPDGSALGSPFFVMARLQGRVPPDVMPYNMGSWLMDADPADQQHLVHATTKALAGIHELNPENTDLSFLPGATGDGSALRRHFEATRAYYDWAHDGNKLPILDRSFAWLEANWPEDEGDTVLLWGDARIGNVLYDGFDPIGVLDWEMTAVGPREVDLLWGPFIHAFFEVIAAQLEMPGMPDFYRVDEVMADYAALTGYEPKAVDWYFMYSALRHGIVMSRIHIRQVKLGVSEMPADPDEMVMHRDLLAGMIDGTWWPTVSARPSSARDAS